ncbi:MAG: phenylacetic acid degradation protein PaaN [Bacteroidia bacterium]|jgi:phenylacetic acid degradation protein paaN
MNLYQKHESLLNDAIHAIHARSYYTPYPESPKAYDEKSDELARAYISAAMNNNFTELQTSGESDWIGEEISPFLQLGIGVRYPQLSVETLIQNSKTAQAVWENTPVQDRAGILIESLERIKSRFFDIAYATMHTTGQSFMMSFQASGPHSNDRALEAIATGFAELTRYVSATDWIKPMGKFDLKLHKTWKALPKGTGLVIGCSTFPIWNSVPAIFADLITGNPCIVKPHPKAILPIAIVVAEIRKTLSENGQDANIVQLSVDSSAKPITKQLAEHPAIALVDYTGGSEFGKYVESLNKTVFTEKAGVNSVILDSVKDIQPVLQNLALSLSLYSGQMCTAPQNIFIPAQGIKTETGILSFDETVQAISAAVSGLVDNPKAGAPTLGAIQSELTFKRIADTQQGGGQVALASKSIENAEFKDARIATPTLIVLDRKDKALYNQECFGPIAYLIKTNDTADSVELARELASEKGALTCAAYTTDQSVMDKIAEAMNSVFVPVSFNFTGAALINSHAAFSDFHVTGGNAAGNASLTTSDFLTRRFVWVGNRYA